MEAGGDDPHAADRRAARFTREGSPVGARARREGRSRRARAVSPVLSSLTLPGYGEAAAAMSRTTLGARQRASGRAALLFARRMPAPPGWLSKRYRLARTPGFLEAPLGAPRSRVAPWGQREVLLERLPDLAAPTLVVWGARDRFFPLRQARDAAGRLEEGRQCVLPAYGHCPTSSAPASSRGSSATFSTRKDIFESGEQSPLSRPEGVVMKLKPVEEQVVALMGASSGIGPRDGPAVRREGREGRGLSPERGGTRVAGKGG